tara:strand:+ start:918 stop:1715 length:798 start_codon:yes stop_codon:yes gene_type:complete
MTKKIKNIGNIDTSSFNKPLIILVNPQLGSNIGSVARVMANFAIYKLRLVNPRIGWSNSETYSSASGASALIDHAGVFENIEQAITGLDQVYATTARRRDVIKEVLSPRSAAQEIKEKINSGLKIGILFGGEKSGLSNEEIAFADKLISAPINPDFASLNLAQAVSIISYEFFLTNDRKTLGRVTQSDKGRTEGLASDKTTYANKEEYIHLMKTIESVLDERGFFDLAEKKEIMVNNIRSMFLRQNLTQKDIKILFGIFKNFKNK